MLRYLLLALGGGIGTICRFGVQRIMLRGAESGFPWGTLTVNLSGSLLIGFLWGMHEAQLISSNLRIFLFVGLLGGFTTFSTFSIESLNLIRAEEVKYFVLNILASNILGIALAFTGYILSKNIFRI